MANLIGVVRQALGEVFVVAVDGSRRLLQEGDRLFIGEHLQTGADGAVAVQLAQDGELTLGRDSSVTLSPGLQAHHAVPVVAPELATPSQESLLQAETSAPDQTATDQGEPTHALGGGHSVDILTEVAAVVTPVIGFPTAGLSAAPEFPEAPEAAGHATAPLLSSVLPPVLPPVVVPDPPVIIDPPVEPPVIPPVTPPIDPPLEPPVTPPVEPPVDHDIGLSCSELTVNEAHLAQGSASDPDALTQIGTFTVAAPDGVFSLTVGGIAVIVDGLIQASGQSLVLPSGNSLSVLNYDASSGEVTYSYTLKDPATHPEGDGRNVSDEQIAVSASDRDGDSASSNLTIHIIDDQPCAAPIELCVGRETVSDSLLSGGTFGADGGFVQSICLDGTTYSYDPRDGSGLVASSGIDRSTFDSTSHTLTVLSAQGGTLVLNMDTGDFSYHAAERSCVPVGNECITYVLSDNDGDQASNELLIKQMPQHDTDFTAWTLKTLDFDGRHNDDGNQLNNLQRADFHSNDDVTGHLLVNGYLGSVEGPASNAQDLYSLYLKAGESVSLDLNQHQEQIGISWRMDIGPYQPLNADGSFTAHEDNVYRFILVNQGDPDGHNTSLRYQLSVTIDDSHLRGDRLDLPGLLQASGSDSNSGGLDDLLSFSGKGNAATLADTGTPAHGPVVAHDAGSIINGMLGDHALKVEHV